MINYKDSLFVFSSKAIVIIIIIVIITIIIIIIIIINIIIITLLEEVRWGGGRDKLYSHFYEASPTSNTYNRLRLIVMITLPMHVIIR